MQKEYYLDNSATTKPYYQVVDLMAEINGTCYGNSSSLHSKGFEAEKQVSKAKETIADILNVKSSEIIFTSGGTESNNMAISGCLSANKRKGKHIITTKIEHSAVLEVFKHYQQNGYKVDYIDVDKEGRIKTDKLFDAISEKTVLISVMAANNETGCVQPIEKIGAHLSKLKNKPYFHVDAVQAYGKINIYPSAWGIDMMSISAHKIHGPKGVGALYIKSGTKIKPILYGGGHQDGMRSGTVNTPGIAGFGLASKLMYDNFKRNNDKIKRLKSKLIKHVTQEFDNVKINSEKCSLDNIVSISFPNLKGEVLLHHLEAKGIYVSTGAACASNGNKGSHVLKAMGIKPNLIDGTIRVSFSVFNKTEDVMALIRRLKEIIPVIAIKNINKIRR